MPYIWTDHIETCQGCGKLFRIDTETWEAYERGEMGEIGWCISCASGEICPEETILKAKGEHS